MLKYTMAMVGAIALWALPAQADWPEGANDRYGEDRGSPSQMSDRDFWGAISGQDSLYGDAGASSGSKSSSQGQAGKGSFGSDAGDND